jgi:hypothetical protein
MKLLEPVHQETHDVFDIVEVLLRPSELSGRGSSPSNQNGAEAHDLDMPAERSRGLILSR